MSSSHSTCYLTTVLHKRKFHHYVHVAMRKNKNKDVSGRSRPHQHAYKRYWIIVYNINSPDSFGRMTEMLNIFITTFPSVLLLFIYWIKCIMIKRAIMGVFKKVQVPQGDMCMLWKQTLSLQLLKKSNLDDEAKSNGRDSKQFSIQFRQFVSCSSQNKWGGGVCIKYYNSYKHVHIIYQIMYNMLCYHAKFP